MPAKSRALAQKRAAEDSVLENAFWFYWRALGQGYPDPKPQVEFAQALGRKYRADFCWPLPVGLIVEIQGGTWVQGGHSRGAGQTRDCQKHNAAVALGYRVLYFTSDMINQDPEGMIRAVCDELDKGIS